MIFTDTSALFAIIDPKDVHHAEASAGLKSLLHERARLVSTNYVIIEFLSLVQRRLGMEASRRAVRDIVPGLEVAFVDADLHDAALDLCLAENRRHLSLVDCSSIVYMRRSKMTRAFAFDSDFERFGIELVSV